METFKPGVGRVLKRKRVDLETVDAKAARLERSRFYSGVRWRRCAKHYLANNPLCKWCGHIASMVDHIKPRLDRPDLAFDVDNFRSCCRRCHSMHGHKAEKQNQSVGGVGSADSP